MGERLSAVIIARNESRRIGRCLASVAWADEVVVVDNGSTDSTRDICVQAGARLIDSEWLGYGATRNRGIDAAAYDWILSVDADEEVSGGLAAEIRGVLDAGPAYAGYRIRVASHYLGRLMRHGGWQNDWHLRLFDRRRGRYVTKDVHEYVRLTSGGCGMLRGVITHHPYNDLAHHVAKINDYTTLAARELAATGRSGGGPWVAALRAAATFCRMYVVRGGVADGPEGLILAVNSAHYTFLKYAKLWELRHSR